MTQYSHHYKWWRWYNWTEFFFWKKVSWIVFLNWFFRCGFFSFFICSIFEEMCFFYSNSNVSKIRLFVLTVNEWMSFFKRTSNRLCEMIFVFFKQKKLASLHYIYINDWFENEQDVCYRKKKNLQNQIQFFFEITIRFDFFHFFFQKKKNQNTSLLNWIEFNHKNWSNSNINFTSVQ